MNVEIGTEAPIFLFWEYLFQIFAILSFQCSIHQSKNHHPSPSPTSKAFNVYSEHFPPSINYSQIYKQERSHPIWTIDARTMCPQTIYLSSNKKFRTFRPLDDAALGYYIPWTHRSRFDLLICQTSTILTPLSGKLKELRPKLLFIIPETNKILWEKLFS